MDAASIQAKLKAKFGDAPARTGGKGSVRRKHKAVHKNSGGDDKKLQSTLKKLQVNPIPGIEEVNLFKDDNSVIHFVNPKGTVSCDGQTLRPFSLCCRAFAPRLSSPAVHPVEGRGARQFLGRSPSRIVFPLRRGCSYVSSGACVRVCARARVCVCSASFHPRQHLRGLWRLPNQEYACGCGGVGSKGDKGNSARRPHAWVSVPAGQCGVDHRDSWGAALAFACHRWSDGYVLSTGALVCVCGFAACSELEELLPGIIPQLGADGLDQLRKLAGSFGGAAAADDDDDDVPELGTALRVGLLIRWAPAGARVRVLSACVLLWYMLVQLKTLKPPVRRSKWHICAIQKRQKTIQTMKAAPAPPAACPRCFLRCANRPRVLRTRRGTVESTHVVEWRRSSHGLVLQSWFLRNQNICNVKLNT